MIFTWLKRWRRGRLLETPFPDAWLAYLAANVPYYPLLASEEQEKLRRDLRVFIAEKRWEGCGGLVLDDEMKVTIAAQACLLTLARDEDDYRVVQSILVYPNEYAVPHQTRLQDTFSIVGQSTRLGEAWYRGPVILSWADVRESSRHLGDGRNLVWHEFAHQLDMLDREIDGTPPLENRAQYRQWTAVMTAEHERLRASAEAGQPTLLDPYGTQNEAEFFAVVTECFFDRPVEMRAASRTVRTVQGLLSPGHGRAAGAHLARRAARAAGLQLSQTIREPSPGSRRSHSRRTSASPWTQTSKSWLSRSSTSPAGDWSAAGIVLAIRYARLPCAVIDHVILALALQPGERFGIDPGPEEREIADVAVDLALRRADAQLGLGQHVRHFVQPPAGRMAELVDGFHLDEPGQHVGHVVDQRRIGHTEPRLERVLGQPFEELP